ncbi:MAG: tRNA pseudouridine(38-40) synthase TruA [Dehalococcoidia bacterium]|nr:tRNA pseudouridine(38-40) synthase TruA [Dehalococcoidia bacterium]
MRLAYDGSDFAGFQRQPSQPSVQEAIETALWRFTGERITIRYAGRTDAGVHAEGQVIAFETRRALDERSVLAGLNAHLPPSIVAWEAKAVEPGYDPRRRALSRVYRYQIEHRPWPTPFLRRYSWHVRAPLDVAAMDRAAQALVGEHDFAAFAHRSGVAVGSTVRRVARVAVRRMEDRVIVEIEADAYLPHMVRNIVGTLVWIGRGRLGENAIARILASRDRRFAGPAAPGRGLFLVRVRYPDDPPAMEEKE